jgi:putative DNA primase/helicase
VTDKKKDAENATDKERGLQKMNENKTGKIAGIEGQKEMGNEIKDINENIAAQVQKRIDQEKAELGEPDGSTPGPPKIDDAFIKQCLFENEHGDGMLYSRMFAGKFLYAKVLKEWLVFAGHHLDIDFMDDSVSAVEDVTKTYKQEALKTMNKIKQMEKDRETKEDIESVEGYLKSLNGRVQRLYSDRGRTNCLKHAHTIKTRLAIKGDEIDQEPYLLAVKNGVVDFKSGELRDGQIDDYLMKSSPVEFKGTDAPCVEWKKFLLNVFEDKDGNEQPAMV